MEQARALAAAPFVAPEPLPEALLNLSAQDFAIDPLPRRARLFADPPTGFAVDLLHSGFIYGLPVQIAVVDGGVVRRRSPSTRRSTTTARCRPPPPARRSTSPVSAA